MKREIIFENENARLLFEPIRDHFPKLDFNDEEELTEEAALRMYRSVTRSKKELVETGYFESYKVVDINVSKVLRTVKMP